MVYYTCLAEYKECLVNWHKGTGGGSGLDTMFESWSEEKMNKFDIVGRKNVKEKMTVK